MTQINSEVALYIDKIETMLYDDKNRWSWAENTLTSILDDIQDKNRITDGQKGAVNNIQNTVEKG